MEFYPDDWLVSFFQSDYLNYAITLFALYSIYFVLFIIIRFHFQRQFDLYVSQHILKRVNYSDALINKIKKVVHIAQFLTMIAMFLAFLAQSTIAAVLTQLLVTVVIFSKMIIHGRMIYLWRNQKRIVNAQIKKTDQQVAAITRLYRLFLIETIGIDAFSLLIYFCTLDFIGLFPYVISNGGF